MAQNNKYLTYAVKGTVGSINLLLGITLWIGIFLPIIIAFILPFTILGIVVNSLAKFIRPDLIPITNSVDHLLAIHPSSEFPVKNVVQVWKVRGRLDASGFREHFYETFLSTKELRDKYQNFYCHFVKWMGYGFKKPVDTIDLEDRIREHTLKDWDSLEEFIGDWVSINDYGDRPNWEILIVHMENGGGKVNEEFCQSVLLFKIDHGLCDGYTFVHLGDKFTGNSSPYIVKSEEVNILIKVINILSFPKVFIEYFYSFMTTPHLLKSKDSSAVKNNKWMISFTTLDLEAIKSIRRKTNSHFNTVLGALQFGSLRRHLLETGSVSSVSKLPQLNWIGSPTGWPNHPAILHGGMTNHMSVNFWRIPLQEEDPLKRLFVAEKEFVIGEEVGIQKSIKWAVLPLAWVIPSPIVAWVVRNFVSSSSVSQALSPVMCSGEEYQMMGNRVEHLYGLMQLPGVIPFIPMYVTPVSNSGRLDLSVSASTEMFKSQEELDLFTKVYMKEELDKLLRSSGLD